MAIFKGIKLIDDWRKAGRLHSVRLTLLLAVLNGAVLGLAAFVDIINPWLFIGLNIAGYFAIALVRLIKQSLGK
jgi:hypothetical protein